VQVCPTGIDIRNGLQYECIGCAACIDGCNQVMQRYGYPPGLIRYTTANALQRGYDARTMWRQTLRPRTLVYAALLLAIAGVTVGALATKKNPLNVDVIRDQRPLARKLAIGGVGNAHRAQWMNTDQTASRAGDP
jgi:polyferredoxin